MMNRFNPSAARARGDERGAVLALALAFLAAFSLLIGVLLSQVAANLETTPVVADRADRSLAADAGVEQAIQQMQVDPTLCRSKDQPENPLSDLAQASQPVNGSTPEVTCQVVGASEFPDPGNGWAIIVYEKLLKHSHGNAVISGPVYVGGRDAPLDADGCDKKQPIEIDCHDGGLVDDGGSVYQYSPVPCSSNPLTQHPGLTVRPSPPYSWQCTNEGPPQVPHKLPPAPTVLNPAFTDVTSTCRVFKPGKYTSAPALSSNNNYFVSGTYYFENTKKWKVSGTTVAGYNPSDPTAGVPTACVDPQSTDAANGGNGYGVQWVLGGDSAIEVGDNDYMVIHNRIPGPNEAGSTGGISIHAVHPEETVTTGYLASKGPGPDAEDGKKAGPKLKVIDLKGGKAACKPGAPTTECTTKRLFTTFGIVYAPRQEIKIDTPEGASLFPSGIVAYRLHMHVKENVAGSASLIGSGATTSNRYVEIVSTAPGKPGQADVVARAVVEVRNATTPPKVIVQSWRTASGPAG